MLTAEQAAKQLGISQRTVRELLRTNVLHGSQIVKFAPWQIPVLLLNAFGTFERDREGGPSRLPMPTHPAYQGCDIFKGATR